VLGNDDQASAAALHDLDREGVDTRHVKTTDTAKASYSTILLSPTGERTILNYHGSIPTATEVKKILEQTDSCDWVYPTSLGSMETLDLVVAWAKKSGAKVMLNPAGSELADPSKLKGMLEDIDILCLNKEEMQTLVEGDSMEELVRHGLHYVPVVIVSDGPNGVVASDGKTIVTAGMYEDVPVIDRNGAGDAFASGFLSQWIQGKTLEESIIFASANSTSVVGKIGAKAGILHAGTELHGMPIQAKILQSK
jgi:ribokinase